MPTLPVIPETITVHLGAPGSNAPNVTLPFQEYIANVASSELYPTWPENALRANILAQVSFALNRVYTEYYRTRGYDFDITSSTAFDQAFVPGRDIFENVNQIVAELFTDYIRRDGSVEPLFAQYCNGTTVTCNGLSQWGSVDLARQGLTPFQILQYYFGNDIVLMEDTEIAGVRESAPRVPLRIGIVGDDVRTVQLRLNRISNNFPSIPKISPVDGVFDTDTEAAVRRFQEIFNLSVDGLVGPATWYTIQNIYIGVKRLTDLNSEGIRPEEVTQQFPRVLREGDSGVGVFNLQYFINYISQYYETIPSIRLDGIFGPETRAAVEAVQRTFDVPADGIVGEITWNVLYRAYRGIVSTIPLVYTEGVTLPYAGIPLRQGSDSDAVRLLQEYLNYVASYYDSIQPVSVTGYFGPRTEEAVLAFQNEVGLPATGVVEARTWFALTNLYDTLYLGNRLRDGQYPGYGVGTES